MSAKPTPPASPPKAVYRCPYHPGDMLRDEETPEGVRSLALCEVCDGPLEQVDLVRGTWRRVWE